MRTILFLVTAFFTLATFAQIPTNGLQVSYPFTSGSTNDFSPNNNHLIAFNGPTPCPDRFNNANCAYLFDGVNDYMVAINPGPKYKKSRSLCFWAKTTSAFNSQGYTVLHYGNGSSSGARFEAGLNSGCNGLYADYGNGYITKTFTNTIDNNWHMYTLVYDSTVSYQISTVLYYVDAVLVGSACTSFMTTQTINTQLQDPIQISKFTNALPRYFNGAIDDIHLYDRPLTPAEITTIYNTLPCAGPPSAPTAVMGAQTICSVSSLVYSVSTVSAATSYSWNLPTGWTGTSTSTSINVTSNGNPGSISVIALNSCGQSSATILNISVNPTPTLFIAASNTSICKGNSMNLTASGANTYSWNTSATTQSISVSPTVTTVYTVTGSNSFNCSAGTTKTVIVTNSPLPTITVNGSSSVCAGQTVNIASNGAQTYTWQPGNLNGFLVTVSPTITTNYTVTGTDVNGCYNSTVFVQNVIDCGDVGVAATQHVLSHLRLYPNPATQEITIDGVEFDKIQIYNTLGQLVISSSNNEINISILPNGIYIVVINSGELRISKKLMKE